MVPEGAVQDVREAPLWSAASLAPDPSRAPLRGLMLPPHGGGAAGWGEITTKDAGRVSRERSAAWSLTQMINCLSGCCWFDIEELKHVSRSDVSLNV